MKFTATLAAAAALTLISATGHADDHLFQATHAGGLVFEPDLGAVNKSGKVIPEAPGQGNPYAGLHQCTPATDTGAAQDHANVKPKGADDVDACTEE